MDTTPPPETAKERGVRRLLRTVALLRSGAQDTAEAEVYLHEEKRLGKLLSRLQSQPEGAGSDAALAA
jgi:hypothetical protein